MRREVRPAISRHVNITTGRASLGKVGGDLKMHRSHGVGARRTDWRKITLPGGLGGMGVELPKG
jgi:hypothetical protein